MNGRSGSLRRWVEQTWEADPEARSLGTGLLSAAAAVYRFGLGFRSGRVDPSPLPIVSVGSLWVGGAGKTPLASELATIASEDGLEPALLLRGYGGRHGSGVLRVPDESDDPEVVGDEARLHARRTPARVYVARRRLDAAVRAAREGCDLAILDDGMQHRRLARQLEVVSLRADRPLGNGRLLPAGPLREPPGSLARADVVVLAHARAQDPSPSVREALESLAPGRPVFAWQGRLELTSWNEPAHQGRPQGAPARLGAFAGIGWPAAFRRSLEAAGHTVAWLEAFPDHHPYAGGEIEGLLARAHREGLEGVVTTEKDAARLVGGQQRDLRGLWVARLAIRWNDPDAREALRDLLRASRLDWTRRAAGRAGTL